MPRILAASLVMGGVVYLSHWAFAPWFSVDYWRYLALAGLIGLGIVTYFVAGTLIGAFSLTEFRSQLRRR
jgi:putative peptidoglycan lipid II flippase